MSRRISHSSCRNQIVRKRFILLAYLSRVRHVHDICVHNIAWILFNRSLPLHVLSTTRWALLWFFLFIDLYLIIDSIIVILLIYNDSLTCYALFSRGNFESRLKRNCSAGLVIYSNIIITNNIILQDILTAISLYNGNNQIKFTFLYSPMWTLITRVHGVLGFIHANLHFIIIIL